MSSGKIHQSLGIFASKEEDEDQHSACHSAFRTDLVMDRILSFCQDLSTPSFLSLRLVSSGFNDAVLSQKHKIPILVLAKVLRGMGVEEDDGFDEDVRKRVQELEPRICRTLKVDVQDTSTVDSFLHVCELKGLGIRRVEISNINHHHHFVLMVEGIHRFCLELNLLVLRLHCHWDGEPLNFGPHVNLESLDITEAGNLSKGVIRGAVNLQTLKIPGSLFLGCKDIVEFRHLTELHLNSLPGDDDVVPLLKTITSKTFPRLEKIFLPRIQASSADSFFELLDSYTSRNVTLPTVQNLEFFGHFPHLGHAGRMIELNSAFPGLRRLECTAYDLGNLRKPGGNVEPRILGAFSKLSLWEGSLKELEIRFGVMHNFSLRHLEQLLTALGPSLFRRGGLQKLIIGGARNASNLGSENYHRGIGFGFIRRAYDRLFSALLAMRDVKEVSLQNTLIPSGSVGEDQILMEFLKENQLTNITVKNVDELL